MVGHTDMLAALRCLGDEFAGAAHSNTATRPDTTDVLVTGPTEVGWTADQATPHRNPLPSEDAVRRLAQRLALAAGRRLDDAQPMWERVTRPGPHGRVRLHAILRHWPPTARACHYECYASHPH